MKTRILCLIATLLLVIGCSEDDPILSPPIVKTLPTKEVGEKTIIIAGKITDDGGSPILKKGMFFSKQKTASLENGQVYFATGNTSEFTQTIENLEPETTYYIRAFATNAIGTNYGEEVTFSTLKETFKPEVGNIVVSDVETTTAKAVMKLRTDGGSPLIEQGIVLSTDSEPTKENGTVVAAKEVGGTSTQTYSISELEATTTYYVRGFAKNKNGLVYGEVIKFKTKAKLILVEGGTLKMGSNARTWSRPIHDVTIKTFKMMEKEVTNQDFLDFLNLNKFSAWWIDLEHFSCEVKREEDGTFTLKHPEKATHPATGLRIFAAKAYAEWVGGRLPTEAEFEYAVKGGNKSNGYKYAGSNTIDEVAWHSGNSKSTQPVGTKKPNELGLYDMTGNAGEWCLDNWHENYDGAPTDGSSWKATGKWSTYFCIRGGSWQSDEEQCLVDYRATVSRWYMGENNGFRVVYDVK